MIIVNYLDGTDALWKKCKDEGADCDELEKNYQRTMTYYFVISIALIVVMVLKFLTSICFWCCDEPENTGAEATVSPMIPTPIPENPVELEPVADSPAEPAAEPAAESAAIPKK